MKVSLLFFLCCSSLLYSMEDAPCTPLAIALIQNDRDEIERLFPIEDIAHELPVNTDPNESISRLDERRPLDLVVAHFRDHPNAFRNVEEMMGVTIHLMWAGASLDQTKSETQYFIRDLFSSNVPGVDVKMDSEDIELAANCLILPPQPRRKQKFNAHQQ